MVVEVWREEQHAKRGEARECWRDRAEGGVAAEVEEGEAREGEEGEGNDLDGVV